jgi:3-mercaptopyruvate sulfurtransferase SseA
MVSSCRPADFAGRLLEHMSQAEFETLLRQVDQLTAIAVDARERDEFALMFRQPPDMMNPF